MFWQSTLGGIVIGAGLGLLSNFVVWLIATRRDDRIEARRTRRDSGIECLRHAYRLRETTSRLLAVNAAVRHFANEGEVPPDLRAEQEQSWSDWEATSRRFGEQVHVARATADPDVWESFAIIGQMENSYMPDRASPHAGPDSDDKDGAFVRHLDAGLAALADMVSVDARIHVGLRKRWWQRFVAWVRRIRDWIRDWWLRG
ncbi:hypothetical protein ACO229_16795 [Promicromonospora sp. MS192]|uniref:hypothetical protein n=1 Tax=Promicromonospora sp. MS192 TaxID=3412684 RepID=UPI003C2CECCD